MRRLSLSGFEECQAILLSLVSTLRLVPEKLGEPLRWGTSRMIFVNSMSDLFHKDVPDDYIVSGCSG